MAPLGLQMTTLGSLGGQRPLWEIQRTSEWWYSPGINMKCDDGSGNKTNVQGSSIGYSLGIGEAWMYPGTVDFKQVTGTTNTDSMAARLQKCRWTKRCDSTWEGVDKLCA